MARFSSNYSDNPGVFALARVFVGMAALAALSVMALYWGFLAYTDLDGPAVAQDVLNAPEDLAVQPESRRISLGNSWLTRRGGLWEMHLMGEPFQLGVGHARLAGRLYSTLDKQVDAFLLRRYSGDLDAWAERMRLRWDYRDADLTLRDRDREELSYLASALPRSQDASFPAYHRAFLYQSLFDLSQESPEPLIEGSMFAVRSRPPGAGAIASNLIVGRNFAVDLGEERLAPLVTFNFPDGKYPYVAVGWPGLVGVVTAMNARGVVVAANPARTDIPRNDQGRTLPMILRQVMEDADSIDTAIQILKTTPVRTAGIVLLGDGQQQRALVMELTSRGTDSRLIRGENDPAVWATDHLVRDTFERDAENDRIRRGTTSGMRYERLSELIRSPVGFDVHQAASILRDRKGLGEAPLSLGHRAAMDDLQLTHSVIFDATSLVVWVCEGPSALGRYRAFDLRHYLRREREINAPPEDIEADRLLFSEQYHDHLQASEDANYARLLLERGNPQEARSAALIALGLSPDSGEIHRLLGDIYRDLGSRSDAVVHYKRYLELTPELVRERERVLGILDELDR